MTERKQRVPDWAERERGGDLAWIRENLQVFWPLAQRGYQAVGRGAIVVDTTDNVMIYACCTYIAILAVAIVAYRCQRPELARSRTNVLAWA